MVSSGTGDCNKWSQWNEGFLDDFSLSGHGLSSAVVCVCDLFFFLFFCFFFVLLRLSEKELGYFIEDVCLGDDVSVTWCEMS